MSLGAGGGPKASSCRLLSSNAAMPGNGDIFELTIRGSSGSARGGIHSLLGPSCWSNATLEIESLRVRDGERELMDG
jgi:hypothetical protein